MKKAAALILLVATIFMLVGCNKVYKPVDSTEEESRTVMTLSFGNKTYQVKYELYRALFLTYRDEVDGGDRSVWQGESKADYIEKINKRIIERAVDIYSTFAVAESIGINPYSTEVEKEINNYINVSIEGGALGDTLYPGYESYEAYLAALESLYLNYSVQTLLFRYSIVSDLIDDYYMGTLTEDTIESGVVGNPDGKLDYTREDVEAFYNSDECVRVLRTFVSEDMDLNPETRAESVRAAIAKVASGGESAVRREMINKGSTTSVPELESGFIIGKYNLSKSYYADMVDAAFALPVGGVSEVVRIHDGNRMCYYIIYRAEKSDAHLDGAYASIAYIYLRNEIGKIYADCAADMIESAEFTDVMSTIDHSAISMQ